jgi:CBS domain-containing protein
MVSSNNPGGLHMVTIGELLGKKGHEVWCLGPDASVYEAIELMAEKEVGALMVMEGPKAVGLVSERDYVRNVILKGRSSKDTKIREIMSTHVVCARPDQIIEECMAIMTAKRVRHLPVMDADRLLGIISIGDLVKAIIDEQKFVIDQLEHYISG